MKIDKFNLLVGLFLIVSATSFAIDLPTKVQTTFKKMYPQAASTEWAYEGGYFIATFMMDNQGKNVWFNNKAQWIMTETDVESLEAIPTSVAEAFMNSTMASMRLHYVRVITFPKHPTVIVIDVEEYNSDAEYQLFYAPDGKLLQHFDVTDLGGEIYPGLFE